MRALRISEKRIGSCPQSSACPTPSPLRPLWRWWQSHHFLEAPARYLAGTARPRFELADRDEDEFAAAA
jgi:hypothetical protein